MKTTNRNRRGFTLMEMLIVVAIIGILIAIAIPVFKASLHKARVAADMANLRAYYAQLQADYMLTGEYDPSIGDDIWDLKDTIPDLNGKPVKLQAGMFSVIATLEANRDTASGYQLHYFCNSSDYCTLTLGA